ncbi:MAG: flagellar basal body-associated protein FliL [Roseinatronobacter sp.]
MADVTATAQVNTEPNAKKRRLLPMLIGMIGGVALGAGGFFAAYSGKLPSGQSATPSSKSVADFAFVALDPIMVSLTPNSNARLLRFSAQFEVAPASVADVERLRPRLIDMINLYLRAVEPAELNDPAALLRLRAQLLRRAQIIAGDGHIRDILITEFVLT